MKTNDSKDKKFRQLSDEELEKVTGGGREIHGRSLCVIAQCPPGEQLDTTLDPCQCVPMPNTVRRLR